METRTATLQLRRSSPPRGVLGDDPELEQLIFACLEKEQANRPTSGKELADALDRLEVAQWTRMDAEAWWDVFGPEIDRAREALRPTSPTEQTVAVDLEER